MRAKGLFLLLALVVFSCSKDNIKVFFVADATVMCSGIGFQKCLQVKENANDDWSNFYDPIEGFDYEEGYSYKLQVEVFDIENPPADASSKKYVLLKVLEKTKAPVSLTKGGSWMVTKIKDVSGFSRNPTITLTLPQGQILGSTGCNKFFGNVALENNKFKVNSIGTTKMACPGMETEQLFLETLHQIAFYKMENDQLKLLAQDKTVLMECNYMEERE